MAVVLSAGNQLNAGSARGGAGVPAACAWAGAAGAPALCPPEQRACVAASHASAPCTLCNPARAGGIKLESLLKLNDVKVTATSAAQLTATAALPQRSSSDEAAQQAQQAASTDALGDEAPLPPVKTLLQFVAWVVLQQDAEAAGSSNGKAGGGGSEAVARAVKAGYLAQQLPELALAVRRMQTGGRRRAFGADLYSTAAAAWCLE